MIVLIINGAPQVGKDTFIINLKNHLFPHKSIFSYSSIDWVKKIAKENFGWDGVKNNKSRKLLSDLKTIASDWDDIPFKKVANKIQEAYKANWYEYFCVNIREPNEIVKLKYWCRKNNIHCKTILIRNKVKEEEALKTINNQSDNNCLDYEYDYEINNDQTKEKFLELIIKFHNHIQKKYNGY